MAVLLGCLLVLGACTSASGEEDALDDDASSSTTPDDADNAEDDTAPGADDESAGEAEEEIAPSPTEPPGSPLTEDEAIERITALGGQLAIGNGPEVVVARPDGLTLRVLDGSESVVAAQPTWSSDGARLAWSSVSADRQVVIVQDFDDDGEPEGEQLVSNAAGPPVFYLQWSDGDGRLAYIRNAPNRGQVEVGTADPGAPLEPRGEGAPFFISWSPAPDRLLGHVGERSVDLLDLAGGAAGFASVADLDGGFSAPAWVDERTALVVADGALALLDVESGSSRPVADVGASVRFVLSPDRQRVAYQEFGAAGGVELAGHSDGTDRADEASTIDTGALIVLDLETGDRVVVTGEQSLAWEWSPDGDKLAWLALAGNTNRPIGRWNFWSRTASPVAGRSDDFAITRKVGQAYLPFFAQYTQSVTGWSPDSSAFAFAGTVRGEGGVWVQLVTERAAALRVAPGDFVTWGDGPSPPPSGSRASAA